MIYYASAHQQSHFPTTVHARVYSHIPAHILLHTHAYSRIPAQTRTYTRALAHTGAYWRMTAHACAYMCMHVHTRAYPTLSGTTICSRAFLPQCNVGPFSVTCRMWVMCSAFCCLQHRPASVIAYSDITGVNLPDSDISVATAFAGDFKSQKLYECILAFSALSTATMSLSGSALPSLFLLRSAVVRGSCTPAMDPFRRK